METLLLVLAVGLAGACLFLLFSWSTTKRRANDAEQQRDAFAQRVSALHQYEGIHDAAVEEERLRAQGQQHVSQAQAQAASITEQALRTETEIQDTARSTALDSQQQGQRLVAGAQAQSHSIIEAANTEATKIAGAAWEAKQNASRYEKTVRAMRNVINGYGDEYLIPNLSVLDELADEFSH